MKKIYLDYAATSPVKKEVLTAMMPYFCDNFGNPSSIHSFGRIARQAVEDSRKTVANFLNCAPEEVIFTSGGTESDNLAIRGLIVALGINICFQAPTPSLLRAACTNINSSQSNKQYLKNDKHSLEKMSNSKKQIANSQIPHIITSAFEHHAVLNTCKDLEKRGLAEVTYIKPDKEGIIHVADIKKAIKPNTVLISIMYVNNEIGTVQPISEISKLISDRNKKSETRNKRSDWATLTSAAIQRVYFHTDAVQAVEYQEMDVKKLGVDMLSISAHKFGGPKGVGVLYLKKGTPMHRENIGGAQEFKLRAGTENVAGIMGMAKAIDLLDNKKNYYFVSGRPSQPISTVSKTGTSQNNNSCIKKMTKLRNYFIKRILTEIPDSILNGDNKKRNPNNVNVSFKYIEGEAILLHLDLAGIAASSGSACTSGSLDPSHVLLAIGMRHEEAHGSIRFTLGEKTSKKEIDYTIDNLKRIVPMLRTMSPFGK